jgi:hypothetical protein
LTWCNPPFDGNGVHEKPTGDDAAGGDEGRMMNV